MDMFIKPLVTLYTLSYSYNCLKHTSYMSYRYIRKSKGGARHELQKKKVIVVRMCSCESVMHGRMKK